jgi:molybdenum cofactor cytidylyltransferase
MGQPKQLLPVRGRPLLQHALDAAAASVLTEIVVVLGHAADVVRAAIQLPARARVVVNERYAEGQGASLACGLAAASSNATAAAILLGDQPDVDRIIIDTVVRAFLSAEVAAVRPVWRQADGAPHPGHPVVLARRIWSEVAALGGDQGARTLFDAHPEWLRELPMAGDPPRDIDHPADYRRVALGG